MLPIIYEGKKHFEMYSFESNFLLLFSNYPKIIEGKYYLQ